ncbi:hypothetical protein GTV32_23040 [Gordonia sp. SID5947]|uniref:DUF6308 family protein n=1 Tax=Gordonia sp. SID5947 TaxID=2690315 RepID=UPI001369F18F|nr:DUF6308 family protein [Gordonia sp. SID5947]MYR08954.1 hypothetical protein [Gordonia sp. SID5947]MYR09010.1 hypothetical protein [Gordonia sp. SID5947]
MSITIPTVLQTDDPTAAAAVLRCYFGDPYPGTAYTGATFDNWDSTGTRAADANIFTADDFIAIGFLSVNAGPAAAREILRDQRDEFVEYLTAVGVDRDLADEPGPIDLTWPAWLLDTRLRSVRGIGTTIASKLIARKRPRLYPIWDEVVVDVLGTRGGPHLAPIHQALRTDADLRRRIRGARTEARLPDHISELRILDTLAWMQGESNRGR